MTTTTQIHGQCDPHFMAVREAFADNFATRGEVGAAVCVYVRGTPVVDLWGGYANAARTQPWDQDTIVRGYPETHQQRHASLKQHPCGNERQDDRMGRAY
jgi:hypothetical protein